MRSGLDADRTGQVVFNRRQEAAVLEDDLYGELDEKNYNFDLPEQIDIYEDLRVTEPTDKRTLPLALLERAKGDIPRIEQLERDHPRMARLFQKGLLPFCVWEQLLEAETLMDQEVNSVQAEAERLQKGWGAGVFSQAYQMLRKDREDELRAEAAARDAAVLSLSFTKLSGGVVSVTADGRKVTQQTQLVLRKECAQEEIAFKTEVNAELTTGCGEGERKYSCVVPELTLDASQDKQWKQIGSDPTGLRLQVRFVKKATTGPKVGFAVADIRATIPDSPSGSLAIGAAASPAEAAQPTGGAQCAHDHSHS